MKRPLAPIAAGFFVPAQCPHPRGPHPRARVEALTYDHMSDADPRRGWFSIFEEGMMMRGTLRSVLLMGTLVLAAPGQAQDQQVPTSSGQEVRLLVVTNTGGECSGLPVPDVRIAEAPRSGIIIVRFGQSRFPQDAPQCAGRDVVGLAVFYRSNVGFSGADKVRLESGSPGQPSREGKTFNLVVSP